jgi:hypothetical protein
VIKMRDILSDDTIEMSLTQNEDMIQTFASHTANEPLANRIGLRCFHRSLEDLDLTVLDDSCKAPSILLVIVSDQKAGSLSIGGGFPDLLGNPNIAR